MARSYGLRIKTSLSYDDLLRGLQTRFYQIIEFIFKLQIGSGAEMKIEIHNKTHRLDWGSRETIPDSPTDVINGYGCCCFHSTKQSTLNFDSYSVYL